MKDFVVIVPFYKREEITSLCFENLARQQKKYKFFDVLVCGSEGEKSKSLSDKFGFDYLEFQNTPLSEKNNHLIQNAKYYKGVIILGSDDFVTDETLLKYKDLDLNVCAFYGFTHCFFLVKGETDSFGRFESRGQTVGAGRLYTQKLLQSVDYNLWNVRKNKGLDFIAKNQALKNGIEIEIQGDILDVKHELNITNPEIIEHCEKLDISGIKIFENHNKILSLNKSSENKIITNNMSKQEKRSVKVKYLKNVYGFKKGDVVEVHKNLVRFGVASGDWKKHDEKTSKTE